MTHIPFKSAHGGRLATVTISEESAAFLDADLQPLDVTLPAFTEMIAALDRAGVEGRFACELYTDDNGRQRLAPYDIIQLDSVGGETPERQIVDPAEIAAKLAQWFGKGD